MCAVRITLVIAVLLLPLLSLRAETPPKIPLLLDTDIGNDIDDAFALALLLRSPEVDLRGVTTVGIDPQARAVMVCRFLTTVGRKDIPVAAGLAPASGDALGLQRQYVNHPAAIFNRTSKPQKENAVDVLYSRLKAEPGKLTLLAIGPLTNIARLLNDHPDCKPWIKRIVLMGGSVRVGYESKSPPAAEYNIKADIPAAQAVFASGVPLVVVPLDATADVALDEAARRRIFGAGTLLNYQVQNLYQLWDQPTPILYDPVAAALAFDDHFAKSEDLHLTVDKDGFTRPGQGKANARVTTSLKRDEFLKWFVARLAPEGTTPPPRKLPANVSKPITDTVFPNRVHAFEDFETDIEKRWWMSGKLETKNVPPDSKRVLRGVLTQDFDDLMGDMTTMYTAVIFNPVPGPPMGKNPRLRFRYWLKGTDTLRVQIYSLSKGYHRCLTLTELPQGEWRWAAVDMTAVRRPDGSGGPLSEDERIDDIQFYTDPSAELLIDDIALYDAGPPEEKRPFPKRILFTGWFDTGKQGKEWPGDFEIVAKPKPLTWKAAKSVSNAQTETPWIRLHLRGERPLGDAAQLFFRYRLTGAAGMRVLLVNRTQKENHVIELKDLKQDEWSETTVDFGPAVMKPKKGDKVDEIHFLLPKGAELLIDDVLLYEP